MKLKILNTIYLSLIFVFIGFAQPASDELMVIHTVANSAEMNSISNPEIGSLSFNNDDENIYVFNGSVWVIREIDHTPYIEQDTALLLEVNTTKTLSFSGINFTPNTILSLPGFNGSINSVTVVSPTQIDVNATAGASPDFFDVVVTDNGNINTSWTGNGDNKLEVWDHTGVSKIRASTSCKTILDNGYSTGDGMYWINPDGGTVDNAFEVYCDMTTDGGGWIRLEYAKDFNHKRYFFNGDGWKWLPDDFELTLTDTQINDIRAVSTEAKQTYHGTCDGVIHHLYQTSNYNYAFGFRYHTGFETESGQQTYPSTNISIPVDGCYTNSSSSDDAEFDIIDIRLPVINVRSRDNGDNEKFGSPLTLNPVWFR